MTRRNSDTLVLQIDDAIERLRLGDDIIFEIAALPHPQMGLVYQVTMTTPSPVLNQLCLVQNMMPYAQGYEPTAVDDMVRTMIEALRDQRTKMSIPTNGHGEMQTGGGLIIP